MSVRKLYFWLLKQTIMESVLLALAQVVLPSEILAHFEIVDITKSSTEIHIHLDEKMDTS